jgi:hypothetical protein
VKVVAAINFYDERPDWLAALCASLKGVATHVVACDGAYRLYPQARAHSGDIQAGAIVATCQALGLGCTYQAPAGPWLGNEVEKRNHLVRLALAECQLDEDWILVIDADSVVREVPSDFHARLEQTAEHVGTYYITESFEGGTGKYPARYIFRACASLEIRGAHFHYCRRDPSGNLYSLWENGGQPACVTDLVVEHRRDQRAEQRNRAQQQWYLIRDANKVEVVAPLSGS